MPDVARPQLRTTTLLTWKRFRSWLEFGTFGSLSNRRWIAGHQPTHIGLQRLANESVHLSASRLVGRESALCLHHACHCWWSFPEQVYALWIQIPSRITVSFLILSAGLEPRTCSPHPTWICHDHVSWQKDWLQTLFAEFWWRRQKTRIFFFCGPTILERAGEDWSISPPLDALTILAGRDTQECVRVLSES